MLCWSLMGGSGEACVAAATPASLSHQEPLARCSEVVQLFARLGVVNDRADRCLQLDRLAFMAGAVAALAMTAALGFVLGIEAEMEQRILVRSRDQVNVAAASAVAAAGTAVRYVLLAAKGKTAVAAVSSLYVDPDFIYKQ